MDADELFLAHLRLKPPPLEVIRWLKACGASAQALAEPELPSFAEVAFHSEQSVFDFADEAGGDRQLESALVFPARDISGDIVDLVAWARKSGRIASWLGRATLLGADDVFEPRIADEGALPVHETPVDWLKANRCGVVLVNQTAAGAFLREASPLLLAPSVAFGRRLETLTRAPSPRIVVRNPKMSRAA